MKNQYLNKTYKNKSHSYNEYYIQNQLSFNVFNQFHNVFMMRQK